MVAEGTYVDTSVLGAYYCPEALSAAAEGALLQARAAVVSDLAQVEFCSLLAKKRRLGELSPRKSREIAALFEGHLAAGSYRRVTLTADHVSTALSMLRTLGSTLRALDALHLAIAVCEGLSLLTADRQFVEAARDSRTGAHPEIILVQ